MPSDDCETPEGAARELDGVDGVLVPGGFGVRGIEGKIGAVRYAREPQDPAARPVPGPAVHGHRGGAQPGRASPSANSTEFDPATPHPVISTMADQQDVVAGERDMGGTMRLGLYPAELAEGSLVREAVRRPRSVEERHRHRYEVNNAYRDELEKAGLVFSGLSPDGRLVEYVELPREVHPYLVATQAHPEFRSRPTRPHPLFSGLVAAALEHARTVRTAPAPRRAPRSRAHDRLRRAHDNLARA